MFSSISVPLCTHTHVNIYMINNKIMMLDQPCRALYSLYFMIPLCHLVSVIVPVLCFHKLVSPSLLQQIFINVCLILSVRSCHLHVFYPVHMVYYKVSSVTALIELELVLTIACISLYPSFSFPTVLLRYSS